MTTRQERIQEARARLETIEAILEIETDPKFLKLYRAEHTKLTRRIQILSSAQ